MKQNKFTVDRRGKFCMDEFVAFSAFSQPSAIVTMEQFVLRGVVQATFNAQAQRPYCDFEVAMNIAKRKILRALYGDFEDVLLRIESAISDGDKNTANDLVRELQNQCRDCSRINIEHTQAR